MRRKKSVAMLIAISMLVSNVPIVMAKEEAVKIPSRSIYTHKEIIGKDRYETGRKVLEESKRFKNIIVVNGEEEKLVDGLCASGLVEKLNATILPINPNKVDKKSMEYINKAKNVYIIGENQAIPYSFEKSIDKKVKVVRIGGKDRYETSEKIAKYIGSYDKAYLVNGAIGHPDAMSISSVAAKEKSPIILTKKDSSKIAKKKGVKYTAIGGTSVISNSLVDKYSAKRIGGETRYETNRMVLNEYYPNSLKRYFTNGETLVDALSAAGISKNDGITFINRHKNHDLLEDIDTVQVGGFPYDVVFVNKGTGTGGSGGTVLPPSKPDIPEKPNPPEDSENHDPTHPEVEAIVEYDNFDKYKREYPLDIKIIKESIDPDKKDTITYECRYKDDNGKYVIKKLEKDENGYYLIEHRKAGHYEVDVRATDGHGGESAWIHVEFDPNVAPTKPEISVTPTDAKDFVEDKYVYDEYGDKVIKYPILLGIKKPSTDQDNDKITYEYKEVLNDGTEVTVSENMYYSVGTHTVKVVDYDTHGGKAESNTVTFTIPEPKKDPSNQSPTNTISINHEILEYNKSKKEYKVKINAEGSTDPDGDENKITYEYKLPNEDDKQGKPISEVGYYPFGENTIEVRAKDANGGVSEWVTYKFNLEKPEARLIIGSKFKEEITKIKEFKNVTKIKFVKEDDSKCPSDAIDTLDINGIVKAYINPNDSTELRISAEDVIYANPNSSEMFSGLTNMTSVEFDNFDTTEVGNMWSMFAGCKGLKEVTMVGNFKELMTMGNMFDGCVNLTKVDLSKCSSTKAISMSDMFRNCSNLSDVKLGTLKSSNMESMFAGCSTTTEWSLDLSQVDTTEVGNMWSMFAGCKGLKEVTMVGNLKKLMTMGNMFDGCVNLAKVDLSKCSSTKAISMSDMFRNCSNLSDVKLGTLKSSNMKNMFASCKELPSVDLSKVDTTEVSNMWSMFSGCSSLSTLIPEEPNSFGRVNCNKDNMFDDCTNLPQKTKDAYLKTN